jgi:hypothetical protein
MMSLFFFGFRYLSPFRLVLAVLLSIVSFAHLYFLFGASCHLYTHSFESFSRLLTRIRVEGYHRTFILTTDRIIHV